MRGIKVTNEMLVIISDYCPEDAEGLPFKVGNEVLFCKKCGRPSHCPWNAINTTLACGFCRHREMTSSYDDVHVTFNVIYLPPIRKIMISYSIGKSLETIDPLNKNNAFILIEGNAKKIWVNEKQDKFIENVPATQNIQGLRLQINVAGVIRGRVHVITNPSDILRDLQVYCSEQIDQGGTLEVDVGRHPSISFDCVVDGRTPVSYPADNHNRHIKFEINKISHGNNKFTIKPYIESGENNRIHGADIVKSVNVIDQTYLDLHIIDKRRQGDNYYIDIKWDSAGYDSVEISFSSLSKVFPLAPNGSRTFSFSSPEKRTARICGRKNGDIIKEQSKKFHFTDILHDRANGTDGHPTSGQQQGETPKPEGRFTDPRQYIPREARRQGRLLPLFDHVAVGTPVPVMWDTSLGMPGSGPIGRNTTLTIEWDDGSEQGTSSARFKSGYVVLHPKRSTRYSFKLESLGRLEEFGHVIIVVYGESDPVIDLLEGRDWVSQYITAMMSDGGSAARDGKSPKENATNGNNDKSINDEKADLEEESNDFWTTIVGIFSSVIGRVK